MKKYIYILASIKKYSFKLNKTLKNEDYSNERNNVNSTVNHEELCKQLEEVSMKNNGLSNENINYYVKLLILF